MIRRFDLWINFIPLKLISIFCVLPINFNVRSGQIKVLQTGWRYWIWVVWWVNSSLYGFYKVTRLIYCLTFGAYAQFNHLAMHISLSSFSTDMFIWSVVLFTRNQPVNEAVFNQLICDKSNKVKRRHYSVQEWFMLFLPVTLYRCAYGIINMYIIDPTSKEFYYSALPDHWQNEYVLTFFIAYEGCMVTYWMAVCYYGTFMQILFIQNCNDKLDSGVNKYKYKIVDDLVEGYGNLKRECKMLRVLELSINYFNFVHRYCIFSDKVNLILQGTSYWFYFVRFSYNAELRYQYGYNAIYLPLLFVITYDKGFSIPTKMNNLKNQVLIASHLTMYESSRDYIKRHIKSVADVGIKVGSFHTLERISTPIFVNFIIQQAVSLLIAFPA